MRKGCNEFWIRNVLQSLFPEIKLSKRISKFKVRKVADTISIKYFMSVGEVN